MNMESDLPTWHDCPRCQGDLMLDVPGRVLFCVDCDVVFRQEDFWDPNGDSERLP